MAFLPPDPVPEGWRTRFHAGLRLCAGAAARLARKRGARIAAAVVAVVIAVNAGIAISIFAASHHEASSWPGSSFTFWPERDWASMERRIASVILPDRMERVVLGEVTYHQGTFPVNLFRLHPASGEPQPMKVLLVSGVHGTETAGVEALLKLVESLARSPSRYPQVFMDVVPIANPWGWTYGYRYNGDGEDMNRDYASNRTREAALMRRLIAEDGPFDLVMDLHESKKVGYFIYQYLPSEEGLGDEYVKLVESLGKPTENHYTEWIFQARDGILQTPSVVLPWIALGRSLSLEQYARLHGTRHAYTVETPVTDVFADRVAVHQKAALRLIDKLSEAQVGK